MFEKKLGVEMKWNELGVQKLGRNPGSRGRMQSYILTHFRFSRESL